MAFDPFASGGRGGGAPVAAPGAGGGAYGAIGGPLPFSGGGNDYASAYNAALNFNKANYNQILSGYQGTASALQAGQAPIKSGYDALTANVLGGIQGIDASQRQSINNQYAQQRGAASQQLINRGLGNSTVQQSVDRGLLTNRDQSNLALTNATQGLNAQYLSQLGSQSLGYQDRANQQNAQQANQQLQWMNSVNAGYPDASAYMKLAQMKGQSGAGGGVGQGSVSSSGGAIPGLGGQMSYANNAGWGGGGVNSGYGAYKTGATVPYATDANGQSYNPQDYGMPASGYTSGTWGMGGGWNGWPGGGGGGAGGQEDWINEQDAQMGGQDNWMAAQDAQMQGVDEWGGYGGDW